MYLKNMKETVNGFKMVNLGIKKKGGGHYKSEN
jgi:hypothetical protein